ncbi:MAG: PRC-barrel domain containing protein [Devosia sp.]|uniref:PRC-barrel domain-containing protein n=1 Tax=Devosia sp. TaxID=1871048 RepID=UPI002631F43F|nr:PRC-barrel domain-containing protein [Devosia sp.]MDB5586375.1 PRC-barrel domain containing protein [Devosia sp.]
MIRTLLTTTALSIMLTAGVLAQDAPATVDSTVDTTVDAVNSAVTATGEAVKDAAADAQDAVHNATAREPWDISAGYVAVDTDNLATKLIGQSVYSSTGDDAQDIGKVSDLVFDANGQIVAAIIGVGGFIGIGEKSVAVDFRTLEFTLAADNTERWVLPTTADALTAAPEFVWKDDKPADAVTPAADGGAMAPADTTPAPAVQ